jgi:hypothetical protein
MHGWLHLSPALRTEVAVGRMKNVAVYHVLRTDDENYLILLSGTYRKPLKRPFEE